ncbi:MAG: polyisoprenoid-binding protein [Leifsonia xyli]|nr:MAG: polyisoprenoid-binding protein [Leifsonia xyli]
MTTHPQFTAGTWKLDTAHSELSFSVRHLVVSKVRGVFENFDVTIVTSPDESETTLEATIDIASVDTRNEMRDGHLRTGDFFLVDEHPTATYRGTAVTLDGDHFTVEGELTLRGVTRPVALKGEFLGIVTNGYGQTVAAASATTTINRTDFGVNWNTALEAGGMTLGDDVALTFELQVVKQD